MSVGALTRDILGFIIPELSEVEQPCSSKIAERVKIIKIPKGKNLWFLSILVSLQFTFYS